jgi:hypothetical protein
VIEVVATAMPHPYRVSAVRVAMDDVGTVVRSLLRDALAANRCQAVVVSIHPAGEGCDHEVPA